MPLTGLDLRTAIADGNNVYDNPRLCVGARMLYRAVFDTGFPVAKGPSDLYGIVYFNIASHLPIGAAPLPYFQPPPNPHYTFTIPFTPPLNTPIPLAYSGHNTQRNGTATLTIDDTNTNYRFILDGWLMLVEDQDSFTPFWQNPRRLLFNSINSGLALSNNTASVYNQDREFRVSCRYANGNGWDYADLNLVSSRRWYERETYDMPPVYFTDFQVGLKINGVGVDYLSTIEEQELEFTFKVSFLPPGKTYLYLIRVDANDTTKTFIDNYAGTFAEVVPTPSNTFLPKFAGLDIFKGPTSGLLPYSIPSTWGAILHTHPANLVNGAKYRFVLVVYADTPGKDKEAYSLISQEFQASAIPAPCPPGVQAYINDIRTTHPSIAKGLAGYERIRSNITWIQTPFQQCRQAKNLPGDLRASATQMIYRVYEQVGTIRHVLFEAIGNKTGPNTIAGQNLLAIWANNSWQADANFRIRWEPNVPNLYDFDTSNNVVSAGTSNQDWINKSLWGEWVLVLNHTVPVPHTEEYVYRQRLYTVPPSTCYSFRFEDQDGNIIRNLCDNVERLKIRVTACANWQAGDRLVWAIVPENYILQDLREYESWTPSTLTQLQQSPFLFGDSTWSSAGQAVIEVDIDSLESLRRYRLIIINKRLVQPPATPCVDCSQYVGQPLVDEYLQQLIDCYLFDMQNNFLA